MVGKCRFVRFFNLFFSYNNLKMDIIILERLIEKIRKNELRALLFIGIYNNLISFMSGAAFFVVSINNYQ